MEIRLTQPEDLEKVLKIYDNARLFMRKNGNPTQWVNGYPSKELIWEDIHSKKSFVCCDGDSIEAVFYFCMEEEPTYRKIYDGYWLNAKPYGVVHRIASAFNKKGAAAYCLKWCYEKSKNIKIDTHSDNLPMQKLLKKEGFVRCGTILLADGAPRWAYQKSEL